MPSKGPMNKFFFSETHPEFLWSDSRAYWSSVRSNLGFVALRRDLRRQPLGLLCEPLCCTLVALFVGWSTPLVMISAKGNAIAPPSGLPVAPPRGAPALPGLGCGGLHRLSGVAILPIF